MATEAALADNPGAVLQYGATEGFRPDAKQRLPSCATRAPASRRSS